TDGRELRRVHWCVPRRRHERGRGEVVDLTRLRGAQRLREGSLVEQVGLVQFDEVLDVCEVLVRRRARPDEARYLVPCLEQELGQVRAVLAADAGDERALHAAILYAATVAAVTVSHEKCSRALSRP